MYSTRNDISESTRSKVIELLNERLADSIALFNSLKHAHWNVRGPSFVEHHELFDSIATEAATWSDDVAERAVQLGGVADGNLERVAKHAKIRALSEKSFIGLELVAAVADHLASYGKNIRGAIDRADDIGDKDTADLFTGISRAVDKQLWFLEVHLETKQHSSKPQGKKKK